MTVTKKHDKLDELIGLPASEFVVHRKPMLLLDQLVRIKPESAVCEWRVREDDVFLQAGLGVPAYTGIEYMAQCIAVHGGACEHVLGFPPSQGFLLGTRNYSSSVPYFVLGATYQVKCKRLISNPDGMSSFHCAISTDNQVIVEARISVLQKSIGASFNE